MPHPVGNHATTPVLDGVGPAIPDPVDCEALKAEFGINTNTHQALTSGPTKANSRTAQSHHILQDAQAMDIISRPEGRAVILADSRGGSEHGIINRRQEDRKKNKGGAGGPASTFGELKKEARDDLVAGLKGKREGKTSKQPITDKQAEDLADCLVAEAEAAAKKSAKDNNRTLDDNTKVKPFPGCLTRGTVVWLASGEPRAVEALAPGDALWTPQGEAPLVRVDLCTHDIVELSLGDTVLRLATYHPLMSDAGEWRRADAYRVGDRVRTVGGPLAVVERRQVTAEPTYRLGLAAPSTCAVGTAGVLASMTHGGPVVIRSEIVRPWTSPPQGEACLQS
jgi:hypothetical protein